MALIHSSKWAFAVFGLFLWITLPAQAQCIKIDSLKRVLGYVKSDTLRVDTYNALAAVTAGDNEGLATLYAQKAYQIAEKIQYQKGLAEALFYIGKFDKVKGLDQSIENTKQALKIYREGVKAKRSSTQADKKELRFIAELNETLGTFYFKAPTENPQENYRKALEYFKPAIDNRLAVGDSAKAADLYDLKGELHSYLNEDEAALEAFQMSEAIKSKMGNSKLNNSRLLAKYKRIKSLEKQVQSANVTQIIVIFSVVIVVLFTMLIYNIIRKNEAEKIIRSFDLQNPFADDFSEIEGANPPTQS